MEDRKKKLIAELEFTLGIVAAACKRAEVPRRTFYNWYETDAEFRAAVDEIVETQTDYVEGQLLQLIKAGDTTATIFYLKTKGKKRGWTDKTEKPVDELPPSKEQAQLPPIEEAEEEQLPQSSKIIEKLVKRRKDYIVKLLKKQGKYTAEMAMQVEVTVKIYTRMKLVEQVINSPEYKPFIVQISREGNRREIENPMEESFRKYAAQYQRALRALGMNKDAKDTKSEQDGFSDFLNSFKDDGD